MLGITNCRLEYIDGLSALCEEEFYILSWYLCLGKLLAAANNTKYY